MKIGVIGLGAMGEPMARNLHSASYLHAVWNRTKSKAEKLAKDLHVLHADSPAALAAQVDIILICVSQDEDLDEVVAALAPGLSAGKIIIDASTVSPVTARRHAAQLAENGVAFLDAPVSGGVEGAKNRSLAIMVGGDERALLRARPVLEAIAGIVEYIGPSGAGQSCKMVNQVMIAGINQAVTEALALGSAMQLPMDKVIGVLSQGAAASWFLKRRGATMLAGSFNQAGFKINLHYKDLAICKDVAGRLGAHLSIVEMTLVHYKRLIDAGYGEEEISALFRLKKQLFDDAANRKLG